MKVELEISHKIDSVDLVDQLVRIRLETIRIEMIAWKDDPSVIAACQTLIDWMAVSTGE